MRAWWRPRSVRGRLTAWYAAALAVVLVIYAGGVYALLRHALSSALDQQLDDDFELAEQMLDRGGPDGVRWRLDPHHEEGNAPEHGRWVEVGNAAGQLLLYRSPGWDSSALGPPGPSRPKQDSQLWSADLPGQGRVRVFAAQYSVGGLPVVLRVVRSEELLHQELRELVLVLGLGLPLALGLATLGGFALARRALAPVGRMADRARSI